MADNPTSRNTALQEEIDTLDRALGSIPRDDDTFRTSLRTLSKLCGQHKLLPTSYTLSGLVKVNEHPHSAGGFADVFRGTHDGTPVAMKVIRLHAGDRETYMKVFCKEAIVWKRLDHPNVVPFLGVAPGYQACIVSEWMDHGDVMSYLEQHPRADRVELITGIASGLEYMHASGIVHGDIKGRNVLVDRSGHARLGDFGLSTTVLGTTSLAATAGSSANWGSFRYMAPELNDGMAKDKILTSKSDVYAFGMTTWEIFDGRQPFHDITSIFVVLREVLDGKRPSRPPHAKELGLDDFVWRIAVSSCWAADPSERPQMSEVLGCLGYHKAARGVIAKLLHEGLSDADRQKLDQLLFAEIGGRAMRNVANARKLFQYLDIMLEELTDSNLRETHTPDIILVLGLYSSLLPGKKLYPTRIMEKLLSHVDHRQFGTRQDTGWIMQTSAEPVQQRTMQGHTHDVLSVSFSPDGSQIASGSGDNTIRIWNAHTGKEIREPLRGHTYWVRSVSFSPDGKRLASASGDGTVRLWDVETGQRIGQPLQGHTRSVFCVAFSPDGNRIVSGSHDATLRLWDAHTGQAIGEPLWGHSNYVSSVAFSPDGKHIASGSGDHTIRLWDAETGQPVGDPLQGHDSSVWSVAYSPDGARIVSGSDDMTIRIWDAQTRQTVLGPLQGHENEVTSVAFSPDGKYVVSGSYDRRIRIWDAQTGQTVAGPWEAHGGEYGVRSVAFSPDGKHLVSGGSDNLVKIWDGEVD